MNAQIKNNTKGFTIIEVVLVLAIAGLIFLMVFIALPALQRSQRDTQRKTDLSRATTMLSNYQSANRNNLPPGDDAGWNTFATNYLRVGGDTFADPSEGDYVFDYRGTNRATPTALSSTVYVHESSTCQGETVAAAGTRKVALSFKLEGGGVACVNN
jgi:prepilin-type N-terminal cleavage/methylation domain-containing protein